MSRPIRIVLAWLGVVVAAVVAFYADIYLALSCFDCANPPSTWVLLLPWLLPAGMLIVALWVSIRSPRS